MTHKQYFDDFMRLYDEARAKGLVRARIFSQNGKLFLVSGYKPRSACVEIFKLTKVMIAEGLGYEDVGNIHQAINVAQNSGVLFPPLRSEPPLQKPLSDCTGSLFT